MTPIRNLTAYIHVNDMEASMAFYRRLGFEIRNTHTPHGHEKPVWAWLQSHNASLMIGQANPPVDPEVQGAMFWIYVDDVAAKRAELLEAGLTPSEITYPFWSTRGEFRLADPSGYAIFFSHV